MTTGDFKVLGLGCVISWLDKERNPWWLSTMLGQNVTVTTILNALIQADAAVAQQPEHFQS